MGVVIMKVKLTTMCKINDQISSLKSSVMSDVEEYDVATYWCIMAHLDDVSDLIRKVFNLEKAAEYPTKHDWSMKQ